MYIWNNVIIDLHDAILFLKIVIKKIKSMYAKIFNRILQKYCKNIRLLIFVYRFKLGVQFLLLMRYIVRLCGNDRLGKNEPKTCYFAIAYWNSFIYEIRLICNVTIVNYYFINRSTTYPTPRKAPPYTMHTPNPSQGTT